ncbi:MAG: energy transducer TonB [Akkermansiaceae bacterium]
MPTRSSQILVWTCVALLTLGVHAAALYLIRFPKHEAPKKITPLVRLDLSILQPAPNPVPEPATIAEPPTPEPRPDPIPEVVPEPTPPPPPPVPETPQPKPEPPKPDPPVIKKQLAEKAAAERQKKEQLQREKAQRELARKRLEEKRRKEKATRAAAEQKEAAARKRAALAQQIRTKAKVISRKAPTYPRSSRKAGHQGTTILRITIGTNGRVTSARIKKSSGHSALDKAALSAVRTWKFSPAVNGLGQKVPYSTDAPISFKTR